MQSKLQTLSGLRLTPIEIPWLRRERTGYTNLFSCQLRGCRVCSVCQGEGISDSGERGAGTDSKRIGPPWLGPRVNHTLQALVRGVDFVGVVGLFPFTASSDIPERPAFRPHSTHPETNVRQHSCRLNACRRTRACPPLTSSPRAHSQTSTLPGRSWSGRIRPPV